MDLRAQLRAMHQDAVKKPSPAPAPPARGCFRRDTLLPLSGFPGAFELDTEALRRMAEDPKAVAEGRHLPLPETIDPKRILYLDTETTGLSGGAGTIAFEVGLGWLGPEGFTVRQLVMRDYPEEGALLKEVADIAQGCEVMCTFNGRTFDLPLLESRFLMNRIRTSCLDKPHIDLLHIARRVFRLRLGQCNLTRLEEAVLGQERTDDLPGAEVPRRFFDYTKSRDFSLLEDVLRHNLQDIASLQVLLNRMTSLFAHPETAGHGADILSMGVALERFRHGEEARDCYRLVPTGRWHADGQTRLAQSLRRAGEQEAAREVWLGMISRREGGITPYVELAKIYEHQDRDYDAALEMTRRAMVLLAERALLDAGAVQADQNALQYRYDRLRRKRSGRED
ncbi:MAG: ribonuclease H-like domain-containing protein [Clostridia bacterium]|nr:ribonuclease H-like domain-containing protein [Clostridia bacterium]